MDLNIVNGGKIMVMEDVIGRNILEKVKIKERSISELSGRKVGCERRIEKEKRGKEKKKGEKRKRKRKRKREEEREGKKRK
ncbi:hypothetical protein, partial [Staphylococcus aureus]